MLYKSRIFIFEVTRLQLKFQLSPVTKKLEIVATREEKRSVLVLDSCRGQLVTSTEGPDVSKDNLGFKIQLYRLQRTSKNLDAKPTEPTKVLPCIITVDLDHILLGDVYKGISILQMEDKGPAVQDYLRKKCDSLADTKASAAELWNPGGEEQLRTECLAVVGTYEQELQLFKTRKDRLICCANMRLNYQICRLKRSDDRVKVFFMSRTGIMGEIKEIKGNDYRLMQALQECMSVTLPWKGGLTIAHKCRIPPRKVPKPNSVGGTIQKNMISVGDLSM